MKDVFTIRPWLKCSLMGPESGLTVEQINKVNEDLTTVWERHQTDTRARLEKVKSRWPDLKYCQAAIHAIENPVPAGELIAWNPVFDATATLTQALVGNVPSFVQMAISTIRLELNAAFIGWLKLFAKLVQEEARAQLERFLSERNPSFTGPPLAPLEYRPQAQSNAPNIAA